MDRLTKVALVKVTRILTRAGVTVGGPNPWDIEVHDDRFYRRALWGGSLGIGESYMDGMWDCERIDLLAARLLSSGADGAAWDVARALVALRERLVNPQSAARAGEIARAHYDLDGALFERMLGPTMCYSCAYFRGATDLDGAQAAKMDLVCKKLDLRPGERLLDIGCGWGTLLRHAAENYGCAGVGVTVSRPQRDYAEARAGKLAVRYLLADYRSPAVAAFGPFDKIASVGMFEHVGWKNHRRFMRTARALLARDGLFLLHTIGNDHAPSDPWVDRYIFPNSMLPSAAAIAQAARGLFVVEDWQNLRPHYHRTLLEWHARFERHAEESALDPRFRRMWRFYLLATAGSFLSGTRNQLWQVVLSPRGAPAGYCAPR